MPTLVDRVLWPTSDEEEPSKSGPRSRNDVCSSCHFKGTAALPSAFVLATLNINLPAENVLSKMDTIVPMGKHCVTRNTLFMGTLANNACEEVEAK